MALKPVFMMYRGRNGVAGLTDVKAGIYKNSASVAVGSSAVALAALDASNYPGIYTATLTAAQLTTLGFAVGDTLVAEVDSVGTTAPAQFKQVITAISTDDLDAHLTLIDSSVASVKSDTSSTLSNLLNATTGLPAILAQTLAIANNAGLAIAIPQQTLRPASGSNPYSVDVFVYNEKNMLVEPDNQTVTVSVINQAGADRSTYFTGTVSSGLVTATRVSMGHYRFFFAIPYNAAQEQINFTINYTVAGAATSRPATTTIVSDVQADGFAQQMTMLDVQTRATNIQSLLNDSTIGLAAQVALENAIKAKTDLLADGTIGLAAIKTLGNSILQEVQTNVEGVGFNASTDTLMAISAYMRKYLYTGGQAI